MVSTLKGKAAATPFTEENLIKSSNHCRQNHEDNHKKGMNNISMGSCDSSIGRHVN